VAHRHDEIASLLRDLDLGSSVAESDNLLKTARVETSAFTDLLNDRVDLVPGTKGSGKSALFRMFVDFLPDYLLRQRKVVVAHGVDAPGDNVFHAFKEEFSRLSETEFVSFWSVYLVSLAHEQFVKGPRYHAQLRRAGNEIASFRRACERARIPEITARKSLKGVLEWVLYVLASWRPKATFRLPNGSGEVEVDLFGGAEEAEREPRASGLGETLPKYVNEISETLEAVLKKADLSLWLMVDRLDEIFPRRSGTERNALRGLLRAMRYFASGRIRVKVFLRDDMLDQVVRAGNGFTALTHITARRADTLRWTDDHILEMIVKRFFASEPLSEYLDVDPQKIEASAEYRAQCFYRVFPQTVAKGSNQSSTLRWICSRCADGRNVVTPRDVLVLLTGAKQRQQDTCVGEPDALSEVIIDSPAIRYGFEELSKQKRQTYLEAEFPHLWIHIAKFVGGKAEYSDTTLRSLLGKKWESAVEDLVAIGFLSKTVRYQQNVYSIPRVYRHGLEVTQGKA